MRTTLTIDDDVAVLLERARKSRQVTLKKVVNDALRRDLQEIIRPVQSPKTFRTRSVSLGRCRTGNIDDIAELLAFAEGEKFKWSSSTPTSSSTPM